MRQIINAVFLIFVLCLYSFAVERVTLHCYKVVDGDTFYGITDKGDTLKVNLWGVDCPEHDQPFGDSATYLVRELCEDRTFSMRIMSKDHDDWVIGSVLFYPSIKKQVDFNVAPSLAHTILLNGFGWRSKDSAPQEYNYKSSEQKAKANKRGLWSSPKPIAPWEWRKMSMVAKDSVKAL